MVAPQPFYHIVKAAATGVALDHVPGAAQHRPVRATHARSGSYDARVANAILSHEAIAVTDTVDVIRGQITRMLLDRKAPAFDKRFVVADKFDEQIGSP